jgi:hypothetical protein
LLWLVSDISWIKAKNILKINIKYTTVLPKPKKYLSIYIFRKLYKDMFDEVYEKMLNVTQVCKIVPSDIKGNVELEQHSLQERFDMILKHLNSQAR